MECSLCNRVILTREGKYPSFIHEFQHSYLMLGEHQFYRGYSVLVSKSHHKEMSDVESPEREILFSEMMKASAAIQKVFSPKKMNLCSLGNVVEHLHWHLFPRYADDPDFKNPPWLQMHQFDGARVAPEERDKLIEMLKREIAKL